LESKEGSGKCGGHPAFGDHPAAPHDGQRSKRMQKKIRLMPLKWGSPGDVEV
jgi:hypothetical protein